jgi:hypothetical protein
MPKLFEIFGYPISDDSEEATGNRLAARCPFMGRDCDGGGNRYSSQIDLARNQELAAIFPNRKQLAAGVCSIQLLPDTTPWIVCPRRLLVLGRERAGQRTHQKSSEAVTLGVLGYPSGTKLGVWSEVKIKYKETVGDLLISFDYTFDYVLMPIGSVSETEIIAEFGGTWNAWQRIFESGGYTIAKRGNEHFVEDCPVGTPSIIEIMTSSTSGGNKSKGTTIPMAFEDAMLGKPHNAPGINYRQVWARMASQLIAKSEIALNWKGKTIWVVQDVLVDYISATTALNVRQFLAENASEVNLLSFSYGDDFQDTSGVIDLSEAELFAGQISSVPRDMQKPSFQDIVRSPICPPLSFLKKLLAKRKPMNQVVVP